ncbi:PTS transporter subunit IIABC [uncultured Subdoligranulum sp.]|uniref:PTS transporter subunit IIABC n=1 Tax=uncultured Subdoligranulum sp. TaxID=512298 RepID=UPI0025FDCC92|nr:PTS transporter subunit IIABC [uncultured Subdoligranulum sp.]
MKDKIFGVLQRVGRSFMLPIALLPVAGLLLGIGSSFTNETMLETYGLTGLIHQGTVLYTVLDLSGAIAYLVMNTAISAMINAAGGVEAMAPNTTTTMLGITTLQMGVFGGIIVGLGVAALHNRFYKIQLPQVLSFFGGTRFVPIVSTAVYLLVGIGMFYAWPVVQTGIGMLGNLVISSGYAGTFIYGLIERALIPFGLHHVFYMPFWQTAVGGSAVIDGVTVQGAQNIFFAELASKSTTEFSVDATRFMTGKFVFMIFGLPGAALAMYRTARPQKRKVVAGLLLSAALTSLLTGITEPLEFTFLFIAPVMYAVHCVYAGLAYMLMHILDVCVGMTFSGGLIDLTLFGIMQGNDKTHWLWIVAVGAVYFVLYYFTFSIMIRKMDLKTPGRESDAEEPKLYNRADFKEKTGVGPDGTPAPGHDTVSAVILRGLGGKANVTDVDCCATRLRITVADPAKVSDGLLKQSGASGVVHKGNGIQVIYGPQVAVIKSNLVDFMETPAADAPVDLPAAALAPAPAEKPAEKPAAPARQPQRLGAHLAGTVVPMEQVQDEAFASCVLGEGVAIEPTEGKLYAPADALVDNLFDTHHAIGLVTGSGVELLLHIGIDTVKLGGQHFTAHVKTGQKVKKGDLLISFDLEAIKAAGYLCTTPMIVCNTDDYAAVKTLAAGTVVPGQDLLQVE